MRKIWLYLILASAVLLSACAQGGGESETPQAPAGTSTFAVPTQDPQAVAMECTVVSMNPTPGPTEASLFPPVSEEDWVLGESQDPVLTVTEYSDFQ